MDLVTIILHTTAVKRFTTASYAFALYEYLITFDREVETFWKRKFTFATAIWFLNRYTLYFSLFPTLVGFHISFTKEATVCKITLNSVPADSSDPRCIHFVKFPGAMQIVSNIGSGLTLSLRVYALYGQAWWVVVLLLPVFVGEIALESWAVAGGVPAELPPGEVGCILTGRPDQGDRFAIFWIGQLIFPTLIFIMTLTRALRLRRYGPVKGSILTVMLRDGVMYFLVIFVTNLANVFTYSIAPADLKFANAPFTNIITTLMICRLMLNLRSVESRMPSRADMSSFNMPRDTAWRRTYLGNLGEDVDIDKLDDSDRRLGHTQGRMDNAAWQGRLQQDDQELELITLTEAQAK